jgi:hypothetical protein
MSQPLVVHVQEIEKKIFMSRGHKVMLDTDLAVLYGVQVKRLNEAVRRNIARFPEDFMVQLTPEEVQNLRSQFATSSLRFQTGTSNYGGRRYLPYVFTEQGVSMLSSVLNSERAIAVNIAIMRAFVRLRQMVSANKELAAKLAELESKVDTHDGQIRSVFEVIRKLMAPPPDTARRSIGFKDA